MKYLESITDFFKSPKWGMNLLLSAVCFIIPIVGPLVLSGWHITGFWARKEDDPAKFPDFDFGNFSKYLERGLWPFLVSLVVAAVFVPVILVVVFVVMGMFGVAAGGQSNQEVGGAFVIFGMLLAFGIYAVFIVAMMLVQVPLLLRATITQDFGQAFNLAFIKRFAGMMWKEMVLAALFMLVAGGVLIVAGMLACYVGMFATMPLVFFSWAHLQKQLYQLYLTRGGEAVPLSPKLTDGVPPAMPAA